MQIANLISVKIENFLLFFFLTTLHTCIDIPAIFFMYFDYELPWLDPVLWHYLCQSRVRERDREREKGEGEEKLAANTWYQNVTQKPWAINKPQSQRWLPRQHTRSTQPRLHLRPSPSPSASLHPSLGPHQTQPTHSKSKTRT